MENIRDNIRIKKELQAEQNILKADYEYLLNREKKLVSEKQLLLDKLLKLKAVLSGAK